MSDTTPEGGQLVVDLFLSIDGFAGGDNLPGYFGYLGPELQEWIDAEKVVDETVVMGRRTYDAFRALPDEVWAADRDALMQRKKVVFSRSLSSVDWPNTTVLADLASEIPRLKSETSGRLRTWGSMSIAGQLLRDGLVDRMRLMRFPLLAGESGRQPAFDGAHSADLELVSYRMLDGRILLEQYAPTGRDIPRA